MSCLSSAIKQSSFGGRELIARGETQSKLDQLCGWSFGSTMSRQQSDSRLCAECRVRSIRFLESATDFWRQVSIFPAQKICIASCTVPCYCLWYELSCGFQAGANLLICVDSTCPIAVDTSSRGLHRQIEFCMFIWIPCASMCVTARLAQPHASHTPQPSYTHAPPPYLRTLCTPCFPHVTSPTRQSVYIRSVVLMMPRDSCFGLSTASAASTSR